MSLLQGFKLKVTQYLSELSSVSVFEGWMGMGGPECLGHSLFTPGGKRPRI